MLGAVSLEDRPLPQAFADRSILIVDDEPLIALDLAEIFESAGADVITTTTLKHALILAERRGLAAAVVDYAMDDGDSDELCKKLAERGVPFVIYSGLASKELCDIAPFVAKPAPPDLLVTTLEDLFKARQDEKREA